MPLFLLIHWKKPSSCATFFCSTKLFLFSTFEGYFCYCREESPCFPTCRILDSDPVRPCCHCLEPQYAIWSNMWWISKAGWVRCIGTRVENTLAAGNQREQNIPFPLLQILVVKKKTQTLFSLSPPASPPCIFFFWLL